MNGGAGIQRKTRRRPPPGAVRRLSFDGAALARALPGKAVLILAGLLLAGSIAAGGTGRDGYWGPLILQVVSAPLLGLAIFRIAAARVGGLQFPSIVALLICASSLVPLLPVPFGVWETLPGRAELAAIIRQTGFVPGWRSLAANPYAAMLSFAALLPALAIFLSVLAMPTRDTRLLMAVAAAALMAAACLGLLQLNAPAGSALRLYEFGNPSVVGFFANHNHYAASAAAGVLLVAALCRRQNLLVTLVGLACISVLLVTVVLTTSRMGLVLGVIALAMSIYLLVKGLGPWQPKGWMIAGLVLAAGAFALLAFLVLDRKGESIAIRLLLLDEIRPAAAALTWQAAREFAPFGSGWGSFREIYAMREPYEFTFPTIVNEAHNDWLQALMEGGLLAAVAGVALLSFIAIRGTRIFFGSRDLDNRLPLRTYGLAGVAITLIFLLHSVVDYPLQSPANLALFGFACGLIALEGRKTAVGPDRIAGFSTKAAALACGLAAFGFTAWIGTTSALAPSAPAFALLVAPGYPSAHRVLAARAVTSGDAAAAAREARLALAGDPASSEAAMLAGQAALLTGATAEGKAWFELAATLSKHNDRVRLWLANEALLRGDTETAISRMAEIWQSNDGLFSLFGPADRWMGRPGVPAILARQLAAGPRWRGAFFATLSARTPPPVALMALIQDLSRSPSPANLTELIPALDYFVKTGLASQARDLFLKAVAAPPASPDGALIYNGQFLSEPTGAVFDWRQAGGSNVELTLASDPFLTGGKALRVVVPRGLHRRLVEQVVTLPPGSWTLSYSAKSNRLQSERGVRVSVDCPNGDMLAEGRGLTGDAGWRSEELIFQVPTTTCPYQRVVVENIVRANLDAQASGVFWIGGVKIVGAPP